MVTTRSTAGKGADLVFGGADADAIAGDLGNDTIFAGSGDDSIDAGLGDDSIFGGGGDDLIFGGADSADPPEQTSKIVDSFTFDVGDTSGASDGGGPGAIGDSIVYNNVGTGHDGTQISARITITDMTNTSLDVHLGYSGNYPIFMNSESDEAMSGESVSFRIDFLDQNGDPVTVDSSFTFRDIDNAGEEGQEQITVEKSDVVHYATSDTPATDVTVVDNGSSLTFGSTTTGTPADQNLWPKSPFAIRARSTSR